MPEKAKRCQARYSAIVEKGATKPHDGRRGRSTSFGSKSRLRKNGSAKNQVASTVDGSDGPLKGEKEDPEVTIRERRNRDELGTEWRPIVEAEEFIARGAEWLGVDIAELRSRRRAEELVWARELLVIL